MSRLLVTEEASSCTLRHVRTASCTSAGVLKPTTTGVCPPIRTSSRMAYPRATSTNPPGQSLARHASAASFTAESNAGGAGCHAGGLGVSRPILRGDADTSCVIFARSRSAGANAANAAFCKFDCEYESRMSTGLYGGVWRIRSAKRRRVGRGYPVATEQFVRAFHSSHPTKPFSNLPVMPIRLMILSDCNF